MRIPDIPVRTVPELCREYLTEVSAKVLSRLIQVFDPKEGRLCNYSDAKDKGIDSHRHIIQVITQIMLHEGIDILRITEIFESA